MPVACVPLWQLAQFPVMFAWLKRAGDQALVEWQSSQVLADWMCVGVLPVALVPLWHVEQLPVTPE